MSEKTVKEIAAYLGFDGRHLGYALRVVLDTQNAGLSHMHKQFFLKFGLRVSYAKASYLLDNLQRMGVVSAPDPVTNKRTVLWQWPK